MATHSSVLVWKVPRTEEPGGLQSLGSRGVGQGLVAKPAPPGHTSTITVSSGVAPCSESPLPSPVHPSLSRNPCQPAVFLASPRLCRFRNVVSWEPPRSGAPFPQGASLVAVCFHSSWLAASPLPALPLVDAPHSSGL